jgi:hypothetical protein
MYFDRVAKDLDHYLRGHGFSPTTTKPSHGYDPCVYYQAQKNIWYVRDDSSGNGICVLVVQPMANMSGIDVDVQWNACGYIWNVNSIQARAKALQAEITAWWDQHKKDNSKFGQPM